MNFIMNSGSYFILGVGIFIFALARYLLNKIAVRFARHAFCRKVGIMFYRKSYKREITNAHLKLFMESYFDLAFCALMNFLSFYTNEEYNLGDYFHTVDDVFCSVITFVYFMLIIIFPVWGYKLIVNNQEDLENPDIADKIDVFIEDVRTDTKHRSLFNIYFLVRRLFSVIVLIYMDSLPFFQCTLLAVFSTINVIYMVAHMPISTARANKIEIFNEFCILICNHIMTVFLNVAMPITLKNDLGWFIIGVASVNFGFNLSLVAYESFTEVYEERRQKKIRKMAKSAYELKMSNRLKLLDKYPEKFLHF